MYSAEKDYVRVGEGPPILCIHGWPFHKASFRKLIPHLSTRHTCYAFDSLGMNDSGFTEDDDFGFWAHAERIKTFMEKVGLSQASLIGHDTGATIARLFAAKYPHMTEKVILLNTEMPGHRPPFIPFYRYVSFLPGAQYMISKIVPIKAYRNSRLGFGECFYDKSLIDEDFVRLYVDHWFEGSDRTKGLFRYLQGLDFKLIDDLHNIHEQIQAPMRMIWGKNDVTFPVALARKMLGGMPTCDRLIEIDKACFLVHEEKPEEVARHVLAFLREPS